MTRKRPPTPVATGTVEVPSHLGQAYLYRAYCRCGDLLYVGIADDLFRRMAGHRRGGSRWEPHMARLEYEIYRTRAEAEGAEQAQIRTLHPLHNRTYSMRTGRPQRLPWPRAFTEDELHGCAVAAYRGVGYLAWVWGQAAAA